MEVAISIFLGTFLGIIGILAYLRICKDFKNGGKK